MSLVPKSQLPPFSILHGGRRKNDDDDNDDKDNDDEDNDEDDDNDDKNYINCTVGDND